MKVIQAHERENQINRPIPTWSRRTNVLLVKNAAKHTSVFQGDGKGHGSMTEEMSRSSFRQAEYLKFLHVLALNLEKIAR